MMGRSRYLVVFLACILVWDVIKAADVYVSSTGADVVACGTDASPCASLAYAVPKLTLPADQVIISGIISGANAVNVTITRNVVIRSKSGNPEVDILDGAGLGPIFRVWNVTNTTDYSISFENVAIQKFNASGNYTDGAVVAIYECLLCKVVFTNSILRNNTATNGAVVWIYNTREYSIKTQSGHIHLINTTAYGNYASGSGGVVLAYGVDVLFNSVKAYSNRVGSSGGVLYLEESSRLNMTSSHFWDNYASLTGGALSFNGNVRAYVDTCVFNNNVAPDEGGAIFTYITDIFLDRCNFTNNRGGDGGAVLSRRYSYVQADNCEFTNNNGAYGGAIFAQERSGIRTSNSRYTDNKAAFGGALAWLSSSKGTVVGSYFNGNRAERGGALFLMYNNVLTLMSSDLTADNFASELGAQIYCSASSVDINTTTIAANETPGNKNGQGFYCAEQPAGTTCTIRGDAPFAGSCDASTLGNIADSITDQQTTALIVGLCVALGVAAIIIVVSIVMAKKLRRVKQAAPEDKQRHMWAALEDPESPRPRTESTHSVGSEPATAPASRPASVRASSPLDWYDNPEAHQSDASS